MKIGNNGKDFDIDKASEYIEKSDIINKENTELSCIFDYFDNADGKKDGKIDKNIITTIFNAIKNMDENHDNVLTSEEIYNNTCKALPQFLKACKGVTVKQIQNFLAKLVKINDTARFEYKLGKNNNGVREIGSSSVARRVSADIGRIDGTTQNIDGNLGEFRQGRRGDCYLLAEINSIKNARGGQEILKQNIKRLQDGSVTITLPGAIALKKDLMKNYPDKKHLIEVTGKYHITKAGLDTAMKRAGNEYSVGDLDAIAYELAFEAYRAELINTRKALGIRETHGDHTAAGQMNGHSENDILAGGLEYDAGFILTGKRSDIYDCTDNKYKTVKPYKCGEYGYITRKQMAAPTSGKISTLSYTQHKSISEINHITSREKNLRKMLMDCKGKEENFVITFSVRVAKDGEDGSTKAGGGHALSVIKITDDIVYVRNPWFGEDKIEPIPMADFLKMATGLQVMELNPPQTSNNISQFIGLSLNDIYRKK